MFSFESFVFTMLLVSSTEAGSTSLRSSVSDQSRRLSFQPIADYAPQTLVTDHAAISSDLAAMGVLLNKGTETTFTQASDIYEEGSFSKSYAEIKLDAGAPSKIDANTVVTFTTDDDSILVGTVMDDVPEGAQAVSIQYKVNELGSSTCNVGGNPSPVLDGCFSATGELEIEGSDTSLSFLYDPEANNFNGRTIQGFSTSAVDRMRACDTCDYYEDFQKFVDYYGDVYYADKWVSAGFDGSKTAFDRGNGDFGDYSLESRTEIVLKGAAYMNVAMYVIRELEDSIDDCEKGCSTADCNDDAVHALDEAVAFYTGELTGDGIGNLMYALAEKRCMNFNTCGKDGDSSTGKAKVNYEIFADFARMQTALRAKECGTARIIKERIARQMFVPMIQGTIRYAYVTGVQPSATEKAEAEGAAFAAAVLPMVHSCNKDDAQTIYDNMKTGQGNTADFDAVKKAFERNYDCLGITCKDVGGYWNSADEVYFEGAGPCGSGDSSNAGMAIGITVGVGALVALGLFAAFCLCRSRRRSATSADLKGDGTQIA